MAELNYRNAVSAALAQEMERDERVVLLGEDLRAGGVFKTTAGLLERFGPDRVRDTPISEAAIVGAALGAAMGGLRPVAEIMFSDFYATCWDQVANHVAKVRYMTGGQVTVPLVLRGVNGGGLGFGAQHSQALENWAMAVPGIKVVSPADAADMKGLLAAAVRDDDPVLVFEHKALLATKAVVPDGEHVVPLGEATIRRTGDDLTLVGLGSTVRTCIEAAERLAEDDVATTVVDLRCLVPLDVRTVADSVARSGRVVLVEETPGQLGWASALAAILAEELWGDLRAPVARVSAANVPLPASRLLESEVLPSTDRVVATAAATLGLTASATG